MDEEGLESVEVWEAFCGDLARAGRLLADERTPKDDLTQAEGLRKLLRMVRMGFEVSLEYGNPDHPQLYAHATELTVEEGETSDARYLQAVIDGAQDYRITGTRGEAPWLECTVYAGKVGLDEESRVVGALTEADLSVEEDGSFELALGPTPRPGNWIRTSPDATLVYIRQYSHDWGCTRSARLEIRREGENAGPRPPITLAEVRTALERTAAYVVRGTALWKAVVDHRRAAPPNRFFILELEMDPEDQPEMPTGHRFSSGYFRLEPDEALLLSFEPAEVPYWGLDTTNYWFEPLSYADHRSHLNNRTVELEPDGSVRILIASRNPGRRNWIDTRGHREGTMLFRWSRTDAPVPEIRAEVVNLEAASA
jgi:hypothetical protein